LNAGVLGPEEVPARSQRQQRVGVLPGLPAAFSDTDLHLDEFFDRDIGFARPSVADELRIDLKDAQLHDVL
jgi:hypothetical protein